MRQLVLIFALEIKRNVYLKDYTCLKHRINGYFNTFKWPKKPDLNPKYLWQNQNLNCENANEMEWNGILPLLSLFFLFFSVWKSKSKKINETICIHMDTQIQSQTWIHGSSWHEITGVGHLFFFQSDISSFIRS